MSPLVIKPQLSLNPVRAKMGNESLSLIQRRQKANYRAAKVSGFTVDLLEIHAQNTPLLHVLFIPGNPGVISFYTDFLESLYDLLGGTASVTAIGHTSHFKKDCENGRLFSLKEQIDHKARFIEQELRDVEIPLVLVGHSIGAYICLEMFKLYPDKIGYCICVHPFLALNTSSSTQASIAKLLSSPVLGMGLSFLGAVLGMLPSPITRFFIRNLVAKHWSPSAIEVFRIHVLKYHTIRNMLFMAKTEFESLPKKPELDFIRKRESQIAFLFGMDDHWAPLHVYDEIRKTVPGIRIWMEEYGHPHAFSCTVAGSLAIAKQVSGLIKNFSKL